jgi:hypothetical protein
MNGNRTNRSKYCIWQENRPIGTEEMLSIHLSKCVCVCVCVCVSVCLSVRLCDVLYVRAFEQSCLYMFVYIYLKMCVYV